MAEMITQDFAEKLYEQMHKHAGTKLNSDEIEILVKLVSSDVMLKAFGQALAFCRNTESEMALLNMSDPAAIVEFTRGQGQIKGVNTMISGILGLITEKDELDDDS